MPAPQGLWINLPPQCLVESLLVEHQILSPHTGQYLMRRKAEPLPADSAAEAEDPQRVTAEATR